MDCAAVRVLKAKKRHAAKSSVFIRWCFMVGRVRGDLQPLAGIENLLWMLMPACYYFPIEITNGQGQRVIARPVHFGVHHGKTGKTHYSITNSFNPFLFRIVFCKDGKFVKEVIVSFLVIRVDVDVIKPDTLFNVHWKHLNERDDILELASNDLVTNAHNAVSSAAGIYQIYSGTSDTSFWTIAFDDPKDLSYIQYGAYLYDNGF